MKQTFKQIDDLARSLPFGRLGDLADRIRCVLDFARTNADETIYLEKAASEADFDAIALASLESNLCFCEEFDVCEWFAANDVSW